MNPQSLLRRTLLLRTLALSVGATLGACEGCPLLPDPPPECVIDAQCANGAQCIDENCIAVPPQRDAGVLDAGIVDAGFDGGLEDAGFEDAGFEDAGFVDDDAGFDDGGFVQEDAGVDGGVELDSGPVDAGPKDAGPVDAGFEDLACSASQDCEAARVCAELRDEGTEVVAYCRLSEGGASALGDACLNGSGCDSGLCVPRAQTCSEACVDAATDCGADFACTAYPFGATNGFTFIGVCVPACGGDDDCDPARVCTYNGNTLTNAFDGICEVPAGAGTLGDVCVAAGDCESALCLSDGCTRVCTANTDCIGGAAANPMATCTDVLVSDPNDTGASATLRMCR